MSPDVMIETERLRLLPLTRQRAELIVAGDRVGQSWSAGYPRADDQDVARLFLVHDPGGETLFGPLQMVDRDTGLVIGGIGFFGPPDVDGTVELGYGVAPEVEGRGYTTEALRGLLAWAFGTGRVRRAVADTMHHNVGARRVMEKAGMRRVETPERVCYYEITEIDMFTSLYGRLELNAVRR
ncbi:GNAT family N-acetyltransferase [Phytohabitans sp. LJ34]|uniref:GNAT family N-acetyltransferase n=1 Tax=Phytohabitans sp. LJ34 TaxID=3452217 RepID=UPI003F8A28EC